MGRVLPALPIAARQRRRQLGLPISTMIFDGFFTQLIPILAGRREVGVFTQVTGCSPRTWRRLLAQWRPALDAPE
ncbi:hypothetical protein D2917_28405 [Cupriavidus oxalaticus]|uniref:Uncharacterized protein n=1 Tax=Cupriavidus oxalaticus TaxID=96344 RepID=A0A5P3VP42_9BURK|nr:hypothetical protein D2917_28405 [Cupriavidus oxalaticus]